MPTPRTTLWWALLAGAILLGVACGTSTDDGASPSQVQNPLSTPQPQQAAALAVGFLTATDLEPGWYSLPSGDDSFGPQRLCGIAGTSQAELEGPAATIAAHYTDGSGSNLTQSVGLYMPGGAESLLVAIKDAVATCGVWEEEEATGTAKTSWRLSAPSLDRFGDESIGYHLSGDVVRPDLALTFEGDVIVIRRGDAVTELLWGTLFLSAVSPGLDAAQWNALNRLADERLTDVLRMLDE